MIWGKRTDYTHGIVASGVSFLLPTVLSVVLCVSMSIWLNNLCEPQIVDPVFLLYGRVLTDQQCGQSTPLFISSRSVRGD